MTGTTGKPPSALAATWGVERTARTGPKPSLGVGDIATAGIEIADRSGLADVKMASVAGHVGVTKMALYRYLRSRTDLVSVMFDFAVGPPPTLRGGQWTMRLRAWATELLGRYEAHPWLADVAHGAGALTRNRALWLEAALRALRDTDLPTAHKLSLVLLLNGHVVFVARLQHDEVSGQMVELPAAETISRELPEVEAVVRAGDLNDGPTAHPSFQWGLDCILAGVEGATQR